MNGDKKMEKEYILITELCKYFNSNKIKIVRLLNQPINYPLVLGLLIYNRVYNLAYHKLKQYELSKSVNQEFYNTLETLYKADCEKNKTLSQTLITLERILSKVTFPYALLSDAYLSFIYPSGLRTVYNINILVKPNNEFELDKLLKQQEFNQLHITAFSIGDKLELGKDIINSLLKNKKVLINNRLSTLCPVDFLMHLCIDFYKESNKSKKTFIAENLLLYKLCDIYFFINNYIFKNFCKEFIKRVIILGLQNECYCTLIYTRELFDIKNAELDKLISSISPEEVTNAV